MLAHVFHAVVNLHQVAFVVDLPSLLSVEAGLVQHHPALLARGHFLYHPLLPAQSHHCGHRALKRCTEGDTRSVTARTLFLTWRLLRSVTQTLFRAQLSNFVPERSH